MPSTDQEFSPCSQNTNCPPKRFLRKGEGLKRFAEYKPPLPTTVKKAERRRTFVKFNLDIQGKGKRNPPLHFLPPEILNDDSINLSTEIPKIAPPKIIHTPIRPNRQALGAITNRSSEESAESPAFLTDSNINGNIDNLFKKIEEKKTLLDQHDCRDYEDSFRDDKSEKKLREPTRRKPSTRTLRSKEPTEMADSDDTDDNACGINSPAIAKPLSRTFEVKPRKDLSAPSPGSCALELGRRINHIEATINELREKIEKCECGAVKSPHIESIPPATSNNRRPLTRAATRAAKTNTNNSDKGSKRTNKSTTTLKNGPSADADNCNTTKQVLGNLVQEIAELKAQIGTLKLID